MKLPHPDWKATVERYCHDSQHHVTGAVAMTCSVLGFAAKPNHSWIGSQRDQYANPYEILTPIVDQVAIAAVLTRSKPLCYIRALRNADWRIR